MVDFEEQFDLDELIDSVAENVKEDTKSFEDIVNLDGSIHREVYLHDIVPGVGASIDGYIRFWNSYDDRHEIPVEDREPIRLYIDSCGGCLDDTLTIIDSINFDFSPNYQTINYEGNSPTLVNYFDKAHKINIKDIYQPLIQVKKANNQGLI